MEYIKDKIITDNDNNCPDLIFVVIILITLLLIIIYKSYSAINYNYSKIYLINLENRKVRLNRFNETFYNSDISIKYNHFKAIDGKKINIDKYVTSDTLKEINEIKKTGYRQYHYQLTLGAIGCYLSHTNIWKDIINSNIDSALILEDDIIIPNNFNYLLNDNIKYIPDDYDIILLGCNCLDCIKYNKYRKVNRFWLTHSYIITKKCIVKIYDKMFPVKQQIDSELSDLSDIINIYALNKNIVNQYPNKSDIQIPLINNVKSFKKYHD